MSRPLADRIPASVAWLVAYAVVWSVFTAISVYVLSAEAGRSHVEHFVIVAGFVMLAAGSRALVGPHAARAAAYAFAPMALFFLGSSREVQDELVLGWGDWCGTGRYSAAMFWSVVALPMGVLAVALFLLLQRISSPAGLKVPSREHLGGSLAVAVLGFALFGTIAAASRGTTESFTKAIVPVESLKVWPPENHPLTTEGGHELRIVCRPEAEVRLLPNDAQCNVVLGQPGSSGTRSGASAVISGDDVLVISRHPVDDLWTFELSSQCTQSGPFAIELDGEVRSKVRVRDLPGRFGPSPFVIALAWLAVLPLAWLGLRGLSDIRRVATVLGGREGILDAGGHVLVDGVQHLLEPSMRDLVPAGPVVVLATAEPEGYREVNLVTAVIAGSKHELIEGYADERREWRPVAIIAGVLLAAPLVASAMLGLL